VVFVNTENPDILDVFNSSFAGFSDRKVYYPTLYMVSQCNTMSLELMNMKYVYAQSSKVIWLIKFKIFKDLHYGIADC
jgi:hypothetical protein